MNCPKCGKPCAKLVGEFTQVPICSDCDITAEAKAELKALKKKLGLDKIDCTIRCSVTAEKFAEYERRLREQAEPSNFFKRFWRNNFR